MSASTCSSRRPLGLSALAYALTAYAVGVLQGGVLRTPRWFTPVIGGLSGLTGGLMFIGVGLLAGVDAVHGNQAFVTVVLASAYDALLAPFVFIVVGALAARPARRGSAAWISAADQRARTADRESVLSRPGARDWYRPDSVTASSPLSDNSRVRVSIVGVVVVALFSTLLARLWFLQSGPENSLKVQAVVDSTRVVADREPARRDPRPQRAWCS